MSKQRIMAPNFDAIWEKEIYGKEKHLNRYPFDGVVSFVFRYAPKNLPRESVRILEVGCGAGNNLWFAAREGFSVTGIDASVTAIEYARKRFAKEHLPGKFHVGEFPPLPFQPDVFDLVIDRAALTHTGFSTAEKAVSEIRRILKANGYFFCNVYGDQHSSYMAGRHGEDGLVYDIARGTLASVGQVCFYNRHNINRLFDKRWCLLSLQYLEVSEEFLPERTLHAEWRVVAQKRE